MSRRGRPRGSGAQSHPQSQGAPLEEQTHAHLTNGLSAHGDEHDGLFARRESRQMHPATCADCDSPLDKFEKSNHKQLQGRCSGCWELFSKGNYCPVCTKVWRPEDEHMVGCDTCQFWVHAHCDTVAKNALTKGGNMDYFCPQCRRVRNINNRLAAIQQAEDDLAKYRPRHARTAEALFAHEFEKQWRMNPRRVEMGDMMQRTWARLTYQERHPYEKAAANDALRAQKEQRIYQEYERRYNELTFAAQQDGILDESGKPIKQPKYLPISPSNNAGPLAARRQNISSRGPEKMTQAWSLEAEKSEKPSGSRASNHPVTKAAASSKGPSARSSGMTKISGRKREKREDSPDYVPHISKKKKENAPGCYPPPAAVNDVIQSGTVNSNPNPGNAGNSAVPTSPDEPPQLEVFCNNVMGTLFLRRQRVFCRCPECKTQPGGSKEFSCTQFEQHGGSGTAKKWKSSLRIVPGSIPDVPLGGPGLSVGKWMDRNGIELKPGNNRNSGAAAVPSSMTTRVRDVQAPARRQSSPALSTPGGLNSLPQKVVKKEEKDFSALFEPWLEIPRGKFKPMKVRWAGERCSVCDSDIDFDFDQLVSCGQCGITVHQTCYGVAELPGEDDLWLCRVCEHTKDGEEPPQCCLCPVTGGALKKTTIPDLWAHSACMQWIPEVTVDDLQNMEPISHITSIQKERWDLSCSICKQKAGAKIQCTKCYTAYHPLCARTAGLQMEMIEPDGPNDPLRLISHCHKHCKPKPNMTGVTLISQEDEARQRRQGEGNGLWNAQLFPPPDLVPVPDCPSGAARVEKLQSQDWVRKSHGKRNGYSSISGFWIPKQKEISAPVPKSKPVKAKQRRSNFASAPAVRPASGLKRKAADIDINNNMEFKEVPAVELIPLPEDTPDEIPVQCNGKSGILLLRPQKVLYAGQEISASKFEALCGRGDAKKWKTSLWIQDTDGSSVEMLQDFLDPRKLDRKALANLSANYAAVELYQEYCLYEVKNVLSDTLDQISAPADFPTTHDTPNHDKAFDEEDQNLADTTINAEKQSLKPVSRQDDDLNNHDPEPLAEIVPSTVQSVPDKTPEEQETLETITPTSTIVGNIGAANGKSRPITRRQIAKEKDQIASEKVHQMAALDKVEVNEKVNIVNEATIQSRSDEPELMQEKAQTMSQLPVKETQEIKSAEAVKNTDLVKDQSNGRIESTVRADSSMLAKDTAGGPHHSISEASNHNQDEQAKIESPNGAVTEGKNAQSDAKAQNNESPTNAIAPASVVSPPQPPQGSGPASVLGQICELHFPEDKEWYKAFVRGYDKASKLHNIWYFYDEEAEWIDLIEEDRSGRVRWENSKLSANLRDSGEKDRWKPLPLIGRDARHGDPTPEGNAAIGWRISVYWRDDICFYHGIVESYNPDSGRHKVKYDDNEVEHLMLSAEHVRWDQRPAGSYYTSSNLNQTNDNNTNNNIVNNAQAATASNPVTDNPMPSVKQETQVQNRDGNVGPQTIAGVLGISEPVNNSKIATISPTVSPISTAMQSAPADNPEERALRAANAPESIPVVCNLSTAIYITHRGLIQLGNGQIVSPTEFERMSGKAASKKWKASIRLDKGGGSPGITIGDWLIDQGLDAPKAPRIRPEGGLSQQQRRNMAMRSAVTSPGSNRAQGHRDSCMCVICKQARRTGKGWSGMDNDKSENKQSSRVQVFTGARFGKRAFIRCTGQLIRGPCRKPGWELPQSKDYSGAKWRAQYPEPINLKPEPNQENLEPSMTPDEEDINHDVTETAHREKSAKTKNQHVKSKATSSIGKAGSGQSKLENIELTKLKDDLSTRKDNQSADKHELSSLTSTKQEVQEHHEVAEAIGKTEGEVTLKTEQGQNGFERRALTVKERLEICQATERKRLSFCKSGIHGWGLIARMDMKQDTMVIEYRGETLRRLMADEREKVYRVKDMDCYLFNINDDIVVDATMRGTIGRFTNHCCSPSLYSKVVEVDSKPHVVFFARQDLRVGQELTYDYRFKEEEGDNKMLCQCGAPNCRGTMN